MSPTSQSPITVFANVQAPLEQVWACWTEPRHILKWNQASDDWLTSYAENDPRTGGRFLSRMESRDGKMGFDFNGEYAQVDPHRLIEYALEDGRKVRIVFESRGDATYVEETFDPEDTHTRELQQTGWQAIMDNFKSYVENVIGSMPMQFATTIEAPVEKVYATMLAPNTYAEWTKVFNADSRYEGSWEKGSKIRFVGADEQGNLGGMVSRIRENRPNRFVSIEHLGVLQGDQEITSGPEVDGWAGALENYTFIAEGDHTRLVVDMDANDTFREYFEKTWPVALERLRRLCE